ncbi:hypothetical protein [Rhizobium leguminosarum]|uniref:hypothetical protein n=1 Tax=Rhizobium leguminosarum TaxID=384 RepID=UPI0013DB7B26|nr:hypothetical protein [Rhizobium leguminosarum]NEK35614.1 hypothetical protein [Rhizobium leguminosarum]
MRWFCFVFCFLCACSSAFATEPLQSLISLVNLRLVEDGRYMDGCKPVEKGLFNQWPKGSVQKCTYTMTDRFATKPAIGSRSFKSIVYVANADAYRLASWINVACSKIFRPGKDREACFVKVIASIKGQSGAQFPVAGQVMEDLSCSAETPSDCRIERADGVQVTCPHATYAACVAKAKNQGGGYLNSQSNGVKEQYMFRSGVTVRIGGCPNAEHSDASAIDPYAACRDDDALNRTDEHVSMRSGKARIISTTPEMFQRYTKRLDIRTSAYSETDYFASVEEGRRWLQLVEDTYRAALSSAENPLINAWVCNAYGWPKACPR